MGRFVSRATSESRLIWGTSWYEAEGCTRKTRVSGHVACKTHSALQLQMRSMPEKSNVINIWATRTYRDLQALLGFGDTLAAAEAPAVADADAAAAALENLGVTTPSHGGSPMLPTPQGDGIDFFDKEGVWPKTAGILCS